MTELDHHDIKPREEREPALGADLDDQGSDSAAQPAPIGSVTIIGPRTHLAQGMKKIVGTFASDRRVAIVHDLRSSRSSPAASMDEVWRKLAGAAGRDLIVLDSLRGLTQFRIGESTFEVDAKDIAYSPDSFGPAGRAFLAGDRDLFLAIRHLTPVGLLGNGSAVEYAQGLTWSVLHAVEREEEEWIRFLQAVHQQHDNPTNVDAYYFLLLATMEEERWQHDQSHESSSGREEAQTLGRRTLRMLARNRLNSLREACEQPPAAGSTVLVIDDDKSQLQEATSLLNHVLRLDCTIHYWSAGLEHEKTWGPDTRLKAFEPSVNPVRADDSVGRDLFTEYRSRDLPRASHERVPDEGTLLWLATRPAFILVDQLYKDPDDRSPARRDGPALIRGLTRFFRDAERQKWLRRKDESRPSNSVTLPGRHVPPEIIALSQSGAPEHIADALRAGARDYVVKGNLARLVVVMGRLRDVAISPSGEVGFTSLERLPNATVGLMKSLHLPRLAPDTSAPSAESSIDPSAAWWNLVRAIPKAELHVHAGSCMNPPFLAFAAFFGLMLDRFGREFEVESQATALREVHEILRQLLPGESPAQTPGPESMRQITGLSVSAGADGRLFTVSPSDTKIDERRILAELSTPFVKRVRKLLRGDARELRSRMHVELRIRDHLSNREASAAFANLPSVDILAFGFRHSLGANASLTTDSFVRLLILLLAGQNELAQIAIEPEPAQLSEFEKLFLGGGRFSAGSFRARNWVLPATAGNEHQPALPAWMCLQKTKADLLPAAVATGKCSRNLREYLDGCELSGSLHLKHPFLAHLFAQQCVHAWVSEGIAYTELRASPDGYTNKSLRFSFSDAVRCFAMSFGEAVSVISDRARDGAWFPATAFGDDDWDVKVARNALGSTDPWNRRLLPTVALLLVGKRHKPLGEMIREVSAVLVEGTDSTMEKFSSAPIVGFDLAGQEPDYPPQLFAAEFKRLGQLHVPITVHAGENAPSTFVESAILDLGARRIGHALSLAENPMLMDRMRDAGISVELCPTSNAQTCTFSEPGKPGRHYPLQKYLRQNITVTINTDNPIISDTTLSREFFVASYLWGERSMRLWTMLTLVKNGFTQAFLPLPARKRAIEEAEEQIFDLFELQTTVDWMQRELARASEHD